MKDTDALPLVAGTCSSSGDTVFIKFEVEEHRCGDQCSLFADFVTEVVDAVDDQSMSYKHRTRNANDGDIMMMKFLRKHAKDVQRLKTSFLYTQNRRGKSEVLTSGSVMKLTHLESFENKLRR